MAGHASSGWPTRESLPALQPMHKSALPLVAADPRFATHSAAAYDHFLVIAALFKDEADVLDEWICHHRQQGVEHFFLVNNNSTDDWAAALAPHAAHVTVFSDPTPHAQLGLCNRYLLPLVRRHAAWVLHIDLDEFVYARQAFALTLPEVLRRAVEVSSGAVEAIVLPWLVFGSSGRVEHISGSHGARVGPEVLLTGA